VLCGSGPIRGRQPTIESLQPPLFQLLYLLLPILGLFFPFRLRELCDLYALESRNYGKEKRPVVCRLFSPGVGYDIYRHENRHSHRTGLFYDCEPVVDGGIVDGGAGALDRSLSADVVGHAG